VTNVFILDYPTRLKAWSDLRTNLQNLSLEAKCIEVDKFWQSVPIQTYYLHTDYIKDWPTPWELISDNVYCNYARALGMIYTLLLTGTKNLELVEAKDDNSNEVILVLVDDAKYVLNYWPDTVVNNLITDFQIIKTFDVSPLYYKIG